MKKLTASLLFVALLSLFGCANPPEVSDGTTAANNGVSAAQTTLAKSTTAHSTAAFPRTDGETVEIKEKFFIAQTNDILLNSADYIGKTIRYEGLYGSDFWEETGETVQYVIRYGPGCCRNDGSAGFEVVWDGECPAQKDWVEATGTLESYVENGQKYLRLRLSSLKVLPVRGAEYVSQ